MSSSMTPHRHRLGRRSLRSARHARHDTGVPGLAPFGYVTYIRLYLHKKLAEKRFQQYRHSNLCTCCFDDMGADNPRQLCCKTHCPYQ